MSTVEELHAQIVEARRILEEKKQRREQLEVEIGHAHERQRLRRDLDRLNAETNDEDERIKANEWLRGAIDRDAVGRLTPSLAIHDPLTAAGPPKMPLTPSKGRWEVANCRKAVYEGDYTWKIEGLSWLSHTLHQMGDPYIESDTFKVGNKHHFKLVYNPLGRHIAPCRKGTLAIRHEGDATSSPPHGITFRFKFFIRRNDGELVQWGVEDDVCYPDSDTLRWVFGPDVALVDPHVQPHGIFGMNHNQLLRSEWVSDDTLTVKVELKVREDEDFTMDLSSAVEVAEGQLGANLVAMLESGKGSDVTFIVDHERIKAHSAILCARSEVFDRLLNGGLRESKSREVVLTDCDAPTFHGLLQYIYSDDLTVMEKLASSHSDVDGDREQVRDSGHDEIFERCVRSTRSEDCLNPKRVYLISLLALSHKYELTRLQQWCELELTKRVTSNALCGLLCKAHLYGATHLEKACLDFIQRNLEDVVVTPAFLRLAKDWPDVMLKINMFMAGIPQNRMSAAIEANWQEEMEARQREQQQQEAAPASDSSSSKRAASSTPGGKNKRQRTE